MRPFRTAPVRPIRQILVVAATLVGCAEPTLTGTDGSPAPGGVALAKGSSGGGGGGGTTTPPPSTGSPTVTSVTVSPGIVVQGTAAGYVVGGTTATGTVTLSAAAVAPTTVALSSDNSFVLPVPSAVTVPAGQRSATFPVGSLAVHGTFTLNISAGVGSITATTRVYVVPTAQTDILTIPRLDLSPKRTSPPLGEVKIEATSTNPAAVLTAYYAGSPVATLTNNGGGRFSATFTIPTLDTDIEVRSQTNGCAVRATNRPTGSRSCPAL